MEEEHFSAENPKFVQVNLGITQWHPGFKQDIIRWCTEEENRTHAFHLGIKYSDKGKINFPEGFYNFKEITERKSSFTGKEEAYAKFEYKENVEDPFGDISDWIRVQPLFNYHSHCIGDEDVDYFESQKYFYKVHPKSLIGKIIKVHDSTLIESQKFDTTYKIVWSIE